MEDSRKEASRGFGELIKRMLPHTTEVGVLFFFFSLGLEIKTCLNFDSCRYGPAYLSSAASASGAALTEH